MSDSRPPDDGPNWPERDLQGEEGEPSSWLDRYPPSDAPEPEPPPEEPPAEVPPAAEAPVEPRWDRPWDEPAAEPQPPEEPWPVFEPPHVAEPEPDFEPERYPEPEPAAEPEPAPEPAPVEAPELPEPSEPPEPMVESGEPTTTFATSDGWDPRLDGERRRPTTAEQAVPWMIGVILALTGVVIVLLALIFTFPGGLAGEASPTPIPSADASASQVAVVSIEPTPSPQVTPTPEPTPSPTPVPEYGPLEMVYLGRPSALAPIYLLRRDFSVDADPTVMAQATEGIGAFAWSPDGRVGAAMIAGRAVGLTPGESARALADTVSAISWGWDSETLYAVRITRDGANDSTEILQIDFASAGAETLATITYPHPVTAPDPTLKEAQFVDDGGLVRLYAAADGNLVLWVLGAPATYRIDPGDGSVQEVSGQPVLWAPDGRQRIDLAENNDGTTTINLVAIGDEKVASVNVTGLVSHIRWAGTSNEIVFTLGRLSNAGGVRQDLYVWDLVDGKAPQALTSNGVSFGASWVGVSPNWIPATS